MHFEPSNGCHIGLGYVLDLIHVGIYANDFLVLENACLDTYLNFKFCLETNLYQVWCYGGHFEHHMAAILKPIMAVILDKDTSLTWNILVYVKMISLYPNTYVWTLIWTF